MSEKERFRQDLHDFLHVRKLSEGPDIDDRPSIDEWALISLKCL